MMLLVLSACRTNRQVTQTSEIVTGTSSVKITKYRDTILFTPKASTSLQIPLNAISKCEDGDVITRMSNTMIQKNGNAKVVLKILHDTIRVSAECDSLALTANIRQDFESQKTDTKINNKNVTTDTGYTFWDLVKAFGLGILVCFIILLIIKFFLNVTIHKV
ncbi:hypothetical protein ACFOWU_10080 [Epilithonimonas zeae]|nr:hypothetical protein [Epilithonimonas zeae]